MGQLLYELWEEVYELQEAMPKLKELRREAADVANYCAMIILACDKAIKEGKECVISDAETSLMTDTVLENAILAE